MAYVFLVLAIGFEVVGTSLLKATEGFTKLLPTVASLGSYALSFALLSMVVRDLQVGIVYAVWSGLGTVAIVAVGVTFLGEPIGLAKVLGAGLVVAGVVVLNLGGAH